MKKMIKVLKILGIIISSLIIVLLISSTIYNRVGNNSIEAEIKGLGTSLVRLSYKSGEKKYVKIGLCINNKLSFKASVRELCRAKIYLYSSKTNINLFLEPNEVTIIKGKIRGGFIDYEIVKGNRLSFQYSQFQKVLLPFYERGEKKEIIRKELEFAKIHSDYELSACILYDIQRYVSHDTIIQYSELLTEKVKKHPYGKELFFRIEAWDNTKVGKMAPNFTQTTFTGNQFTLDQLKGKYVILDFWGSWCGWCLKDFPKMKEYYNKYNGQIEFVGIACKDSKAAWHLAIQKNRLEWINVIDNDLHDIQKMYAINVFPTKIILDKEGRIIKKANGESLSFYQTIDSLMNNKEKL